LLGRVWPDARRLLVRVVDVVTLTCIMAAKPQRKHQNRTVALHGQYLPATVMTALLHIQMFFRFSCLCSAVPGPAVLLQVSTHNRQLCYHYFQ
jgi:hypothetical protein